jgi:creatinine amidohydrolase
MKTATSKKSHLLSMTWQEFQANAKASTVFVAPLGSCELEGSHLPLGVDTIVAEGISERLSDQNGVIIGPIIPIGYSKWFEPFPGTISLENETLSQVLNDYCKSLVKHGIRRILFLNSHRGNNAAVETVAHKLVLEKNICVGMINIWKLAQDLSCKDGLITEGKFSHGGEIMTSMVMAIRPDTVDKSKIQNGKIKQLKNSEFKFINSIGETFYLESVQTVYRNIREITDNGTLGDATKASQEKGMIIIKLMVEYLRKYIQEFRKLRLSKKEGV